MKKLHPSIWAAIIGVTGSIIVALIGIFPIILKDAQKPIRTKPQINKSNSPAIAIPFEINNYFYPSGWVGDSEQYISFIKDSKEKLRPDDDDNASIKVTYIPGTIGWAGIFWQYPDSNWGDKPGRNLVKAKKITFWVSGKRGGEVVEFKAGGIIDSQKRYKDSFEVSLGRQTLTKQWQKYEIDLRGQDLSNVIGAFAWVATGSTNSGGLTFYLDDIKYE